MLPGLANMAGFVSSEAAPSDVLYYAASPTGNIFDVQGLDVTSYQRVILYLDGLTVDTANTLLRLQFYIAGSLITSNTYDWSFSFDASGSTPASGEIAATSNIRLTSWADTGANISWNGVVHICAPAAALNKMVHHDGAFMQSDGTAVETIGSGQLANNGAFTGFKLEGSGGLITAGRALLIAMKTS